MPRRKTTTPSTKDINDLEAHLAGTLKPVAPPGQITQRMRTRIHLPDRRLLAERIASWRSFILAISGTMTITLLVIAAARALFHLLSRRS